MYLFKLELLFFGYVSWSGIAKSCGSPIFSFARNHHTLFYSDLHQLHTHQQRMRVLFSLYPPNICYLCSFDDSLSEL